MAVEMKEYLVRSGSMKEVVTALNIQQAAKKAVKAANPKGLGLLMEVAEIKEENITYIATSSIVTVKNLKP